MGDSGLSVPLGAEYSLTKGSRGELDSRSGSRCGHKGTLGKFRGSAMSFGKGWIWYHVPALGRVSSERMLWIGAGEP